VSVLDMPPGIRWSVCVRSLDGRVEDEHDADRPLSTASVGKLLLLAEVARRLDDGTLDPGEPLHRDEDLWVADSGLWQHLRVDALPVEDLVVLVAGVSDNLATNVLLRKVGLTHVQAMTKWLGLRATALHDRVRDQRTERDAPRLSTGTAAELTALMVTLATDGPRRVLDWMRLNTDLSMVASAFGEDPLAHELRNKTGTDDGVRADVGIVGHTAYAVIANWDGAEPPGRTREVLDAMRGVGELVRRRHAGPR
jgi:beta-lactamase class A